MVPITSEKQVSETIEMIWNVFRGDEIDKAGGPSGTGAYVDIRDVSRIVVFGVEHPEVTDGQRYLTAAAWAGPQAAADILRKAYPARQNIIHEGHPGEGYSPDFAFQKQKFFDGTKAVRATGQAYIPFEKIVLDTAKAFEALV